jgi:cellulose synthase operon protein YhjQ
MKVLAVVSAKGGVGKTTLTANLGVGIAALGVPVLLIDLDPQNALQWHLGSMDPADTDGISSCAQTSIADCIYSSPFGVDFVPYGSCNEKRRLEFESALEQQTDWLSMQLRHAGLPANTIVIIDTPPGPSAYLTQALLAADATLVVVLADMASYATIVEMEALLETYVQQRQLHTLYIVNQMHDNDLSRQVVMSMRQHLGDRVAPCLIPEESQVEEALGFERPILQYEPDNPAAIQIRHLINFLIQG